MTIVMYRNKIEMTCLKDGIQLGAYDTVSEALG